MAVFELNSNIFCTRYKIYRISCSGLDICANARIFTALDARNIEVNIEFLARLLVFSVKNSYFSTELKKEKEIMVIAVDFDGTIVEHKYPEIGKEIPFATATLKMLTKEKHRLILWTVRKGPLLDEAVEWCRQRGVEFYAVNKNFPEEKVDEGGGYCKIDAELFIDDRNLGGLPDWGRIYEMVTKDKTWADIYSESGEQPKKKGWFW